MKVGSIILRTSDVDRAASFWAEQVGLEIYNQVPGYVFLEGGPVSILLSASESPIEDESKTEVVFEAEDVHKSYESMTARGVPFERELKTIMSYEGRDLIGTSFQDPDGHYGTLTVWVDSG